MLPSTAEEAVGIVTVTQRLLYGSDLYINVSSWHQPTQEHITWKGVIPKTTT